MEEMPQDMEPSLWHPSRPWAPGLLHNGCNSLGSWSTEVASREDSVGRGWLQGTIQRLSCTLDSWGQGPARPVSSGPRQSKHLRNAGPKNTEGVSQWPGGIGAGVAFSGLTA